jgi:hypothetical protein
MNKFVDKCRPLAVVLGLLGAGGVMGQVVQVPTSCVVVVPGIGGSIPLNQVGDGGIVCMVDPFDSPGVAGDFTLIGAAPISWSLLGDISTQTATVPPTPPVQSAGAVATVNLESYNKNVRTPSETTLPSTSTMARSKGRVTIQYSIAPCNGVMSFDILKRWGGYAPPIIGPNCWGTGLITFSVDQVSSDNGLDAIGFDQYYWRITNNAGTDLVFTYPAVSYTSADRSSITLDQSLPDFNTWLAGGAPYTIQVCYGRCNPWDSGTSLTKAILGGPCVTKVVNLACPAPIYAGGFPTCINANAPYVPTLPLTVNPTNYSSACTYTWTRSNLAWNFTPTATGGITINSIGDANPCTFFLTVASPTCGSTNYTYTVNRNYNSAAILATPSPYCASTGTFTVNLASNAQGNTTCWGPLPTGWSASNPVGVPSAVQFTIPASAAGTTATINLRNCASACSTNLPIVINVRPGTPVISALPICVPSGGGPNQTWTATSAGAGATSWTWNNTMGMTQVAPTNDATGVFTPTGTANGNISVFTQNVAGCPSLTATKLVNRNAVAPVVVQPACYTLGYSCTGVAGLTGSASFTIQSANFTANGAGTYTWTFPANGFFNTSGTPVTVTQTTNAAVVRPTTGVPSTSVPAPPAGYYNFTVTFTPTSGCTGATTTVTAAPVNLGAVIYTNNGTGVGTTGSLFPPAGLPGASTYQAYDCALPGAYGPTGSGGLPLGLGTVIPVNSGSLTMQITVPGGCIWRPAPVTTSHKSLVLVDEQGTEQADGALLGAEFIHVMPNPNDGSFILRIDTDFQRGSVTMLDHQGKRVGQETRVQQGSNAMDYQHLAPGYYTVRIDLDGATQVQRILVIQAN